jgi:DNA polymerase-3 subunit delta
VGEALDTIRASARSRGFSERVVFDVDTTFDWKVLQHYGESLSLFAERRVLDVRMTTGKPGDAGAKVLVDYSRKPNSDDLLLLSTGKLDAGTKRSKWLNTLESAGVLLELWPPTAAQLPRWIERRTANLGLKITLEGAKALAERVEGNLLACVQEIDKLRLLHGEGSVDVHEVLAAVADSARFDVFDLVDCALAGDAARTLRILRGLREEGVEATFVAWALAREIRNLNRMSAELIQDGSIDALLRRHHVWERRKRPIRLALERHAPKNWLGMLKVAGTVDRVIKGVEPGDAWDELCRLGLMVCGVMILSNETV